MVRPSRTKAPVWIEAGAGNAPAAARGVQTVSLTMSIAPQGHSAAQMPQPLQ